MFTCNNNKSLTVRTHRGHFIVFFAQMLPVEISLVFLRAIYPQVNYPMIF